MAPRESRDGCRSAPRGRGRRIRARRPGRSMKRVNIIAWSNGFGLTRHINLLGDALRRGGFDVTVTAVQFGSKDRKHQERLYRKRELKRRLLRWLGRGDAADFDANIMIE